MLSHRDLDLYGLANYLFKILKLKPFFIFQPYPSYDPVIVRTYALAEPDGIQIVDGLAKVPLRSLLIHTYSRIIQCPNWDLSSQIETLQRKNGGTLKIKCYSAVGFDGT